MTFFVSLRNIPHIVTPHVTFLERCVMGEFKHEDVLRCFFVPASQVEFLSSRYHIVSCEKCLAQVASKYFKDGPIKELVTFLLEYFRHWPDDNAFYLATVASPVGGRYIGSNEGRAVFLLARLQNKREIFYFNLPGQVQAEARRQWPCTISDYLRNDWERVVVPWWYHAWLNFLVRRVV